MYRSNAQTNQAQHANIVIQIRHQFCMSFLADSDFHADVAQLSMHQCFICTADASAVLLPP
jgi:hypothetical protein